LSGTRLWRSQYRILLPCGNSGCIFRELGHDTTRTFGSHVFRADMDYGLIG
jgi:hypothetical protein